MARAMSACTRPGAGTTNESHWTERAAALLAPLLYAANLSDLSIAEVLRWTLRQELGPAREVLLDCDTEIAADVLDGIEQTDARERSSIFSATAGVLAPTTPMPSGQWRPSRTSIPPASRARRTRSTSPRRSIARRSARR